MLLVKKCLFGLCMVVAVALLDSCLPTEAPCDSYSFKATERGSYLEREVAQQIISMLDQITDLVELKNGSHSCKVIITGDFSTVEVGGVGVFFNVIRNDIVIGHGRAKDTFASNEVLASNLFKNLTEEFGDADVSFDGSLGPEEIKARLCRFITPSQEVARIRKVTISQWSKRDLVVIQEYRGGSETPSGKCTGMCSDLFRQGFQTAVRKTPQYADTQIIRRQDPIVRAQYGGLDGPSYLKRLYGLAGPGLYLAVKDDNITDYPLLQGPYNEKKFKIESKHEIVDTSFGFWASPRWGNQLTVHIENIKLDANSREHIHNSRYASAVLRRPLGGSIYLQCDAHSTSFTTLNSQVRD